MIDVGHQQRQRLVLFLRFGNGFGELGIEEFAVGKRRQRIGETFVAHHFEILLELLDFLPRRRQPRFELLVVELHFLGALDQALDDGAQRLAVLGVCKLLGGVG